VRFLSLNGFYRIPVQVCSFGLKAIAYLLGKFTPIALPFHPQKCDRIPVGIHFGKKRLLICLVNSRQCLNLNYGSFCYSKIIPCIVTMKAYEFSTTINPDGKVELPKHLRDLTGQSKVRIIILVEEVSDEQTEIADDIEDTSLQEIAASLARALYEVQTGQTKPISELWDSLDGE
jgi:hypothetical protein